MIEELNFSVEFLKERYFKCAGLPWEFQSPVTKEMADFVLEKNGIKSLRFEFDRSSSQSYTLLVKTQCYSEPEWQALKRKISVVLG